MRTIRQLATIVCLAALTGLRPGLAAQDTPSVLAIRGGTIHTLTGPPVANGTVVIRDGRIAGVIEGPAQPAGATVIDATGKHVYPGLFDAITRLGLTEIGAVDVTNDVTELGTFNPHLLGMTAVHPASEHIPVTRANGITHASAAPNARGGGIGGQASVIHLDGWTIEQMVIDSSIGMIVDWPSLQTREFDWSTFSWRERSYKEAKTQYEERLDSLRSWVQAARQYLRAMDADMSLPRDLKLAALGRVVRGELPLLIEANTDRAIRGAIEFAQAEDVRIVILGGREAWKVADLLAERDVPVILGGSQQLPSGENEPYDEQYAQPGKLHAAGVRFAISTFNASSSRTLPYEAGTAVPYGLPREEALKAITLYPAQILGLGDELGTIEEGKIANLIVTDGDPLEITTEVSHVIIQGRDVSLMNKHRQLHETYKARPER